MKRHDIIIGFLIFMFLLFLVIPLTSQWFFTTADRWPYVGGFVKFFLFASLGDLLSHRIVHKNYAVVGFIYKAVIWGFIGVVIVMIFPIFHNGVIHLQSIGLLPFAHVRLMTAFFTSVLMNVTFAPTMMAFHRVSDHYIEHSIKHKEHRLNQSVQMIDWSMFVNTVLFKMIPLFWIPAHTITFMLPGGYRVLFASILGVLLGLFLGLAKTKPRKV